MKVVFFGTPQISVQCLEKIMQSKHKVLAVVTNADKVAGRGKKMTPSPVKTYALSHNIPVLEYEKNNVIKLINAQRAPVTSPKVSFVKIESFSRESFNFFFFESSSSKFSIFNSVELSDEIKTIPATIFSRTNRK